ncbi:hypothetical protein GCM10017687_44300 [Streptomyces echinatus]
MVAQMLRQGAAGAGPCGRVGLFHQVAPGTGAQQELRGVLGSVSPSTVGLGPVDGYAGESGGGEDVADAVRRGQGEHAGQSRPPEVAEGQEGRAATPSPSPSR